jgi:SAM-dependent methyltransferase
MTYGPEFYERRRQTAIASARRIVPWVLERTAARSVVDIGCGTGSWLSTFLDYGVTDIRGCDGPWVPTEQLEIPRDRFVAIDFNDLRSLTADRRFDLVVCLEVAEHLPGDRADELLARLASLGPCILFSAAVPGQGGVGHQNEQWPGYWIRRFETAGFECLDCVRGAFWDDAAVAPWYAQNAFMFVAKDAVSGYPMLAQEAASNSLAMRDLVHPRLHRARIDELSNPEHYSIRAVTKVFPRLLARALRRRFRP